MVKILVENDKLYLEKAGVRTELDSATITKKASDYEIVVYVKFPIEFRMKTFRQRKFEKPSNVKWEIHSNRERPSYLRYEAWMEYHHAKGKGWYINYYEEF